MWGRESGQKKGRDLQLGACSMLIPILESTFMLEHFFSPLKGLHHLRIYTNLMVSFIQLFMQHVWHIAYWRMTINGGNVWKKLLIWQVVINCLSQFFVIAPHLILWLYGCNSKFIYVMIFNMLYIPKILSRILLKSKCLIMSSTLSIRFFMVEINDYKIGHPCLYHRWIGL